VPEQNDEQPVEPAMGAIPNGVPAPEPVVFAKNIEPTTLTDSGGNAVPAVREETYTATGVFVVYYSLEGARETAIELMEAAKAAPKAAQRIMPASPAMLAQLEKARRS
jgi:hypothetical protein